MLASITFDDSLWPLLVIRVGDALSPQGFEAALEKRLTYLRRGEKHVVLYDTSQAQARLLIHRERLVQWLRGLNEDSFENVLGVALVITSSPFRLAVTSVLHLWPRRRPYFAATTESEAVRWGVERLREAGLSAQAERIRLHYGLPPVGAPS
jgi:hypothetical protein